ncbi:eukaryotic translation initiation factor eIF2A-domain-containing protein [Suillus cothurnatus]|nr:eukaryotic translation initiation factor eIF2A-domain-containing protein [Suillus cothurnatus]
MSLEASFCALIVLYILDLLPPPTISCEAFACFVLVLDPSVFSAQKMASQLSQQYAFHAQKSMGLLGGTPTYMPIEGFAVPDVPARTYHYSPDGRLFAYALPTVVRIFLSEGAQLLQELSVPNIIELKFSSRVTYLSTWGRLVKLEDGAQHKNLRGGAHLIHTKFLRRFRSTIPPNGGRASPTSMVSLIPGLNPSVAVAPPATVKIYGLFSLSGTPTCSKTFYKADRAQIKWNDLGTQALVLTQTQVDNSNMSYYGETGMYPLSATGNFDCRVTLDKEGPIHDVSWSPNSKEFGATY